MDEAAELETAQNTFEDDGGAVEQPEFLDPTEVEIPTQDELDELNDGSDNILD